MAFCPKLVLISRHGYSPALDPLVQQFIHDRVAFVGVVGIDAARIEDIIDELCVGDGSAPYMLLTSSHQNETIEEAVDFAQSLTGDFSGPVQIVEL